MPNSGATPSQNPNINAISTERRQLIGSPPKASAVRKLSRLSVNPRTRRLPSMLWSISWGPATPRPGSPVKRQSLRKREREQRAALAGSEHAGQEAFGPGAPAGGHGDVLPSVDAVRARAAVVAAAALGLPQLVAGLGVERVELAGRLAAEHEAAARGQQRRAHRDVVAPAPALLARARVEGADGAGHVLEVHRDARAPVRDALLELPAPPRGRGADVLHG